MIVSKTNPNFFTKLDLFAIEYICKYIFVFKKLGFMLPLSLFYSYRLTASLSLAGFIGVFLNCCLRQKGHNYVIMYDKLPDIEMNKSHILTSIGYIEGNGDFITSRMVYPCYQKKGISKELLNKYREEYIKDKKTYYFKTNPLLESFYMKHKFNIKNITTTNYFNYIFECY